MTETVKDHQKEFIIKVENKSENIKELRIKLPLSNNYIHLKIKT